MKIVENLKVIRDFDDLRRDYDYRIIQTTYRGSVTYGIEVERKDFSEGVLVNIERDLIHKISSNLSKVKELLFILYSNEVSPIHLVDVIGDRVDECVSNFE